MPELPEMETYRILLAERLAGKTIKSVEVNREKSINVEVNQFKRELENTQVTKISRRAKHLVFELSTGKSLVLHLMLGGWMYLGNEQDQPDRTKQVILFFEEQNLYFIGLRLGYLHLLDKAGVEKDFSELGPEPLEPKFTLELFQQILAKRRGMLKTTLLNQEFLAGIGNCYSDEICFAAQLKPTKKTNELNDHQQRALHEAIGSALKRATGYGGYMEEPLFKGDTKTGGYNCHCYVYDREGEPCNRCGTSIKKDEISSRKTFYCPNCQID
ncbi:bifunctional DNA-formamidopyrimidine glycosylase/DNA-(apurinic or apyrimidinic site) lyase [Metabacillus herbersteinensis]|uniref:Formamidopyrimidine-DNA glycosylase n=1 Tax=Metabacillus herbersteinensis TaxID=283816 RepID=A0ABV6GF83_9BACI